METVGVSRVSRFFFFPFFPRPKTDIFLYRFICKNNDRNRPTFFVCFLGLPVVFLFFSGLFAGHHPTRGPVQEVFKISRVGSGRVKRFQASRAGSGRVETFSSLTDRAGLGQDFFKFHGSDQ